MTRHVLADSSGQTNRLNKSFRKREVTKKVPYTPDPFIVTNSPTTAIQPDTYFRNRRRCRSTTVGPTTGTAPSAPMPGRFALYSSSSRGNRRSLPVGGMRVQELVPNQYGSELGVDEKAAGEEGGEGEGGGEGGE